MEVFDRAVGKLSDILCLSKSETERVIIDLANIFQFHKTSNDVVGSIQRISRYTVIYLVISFYIIYGAQTDLDNYRFTQFFRKAKTAAKNGCAAGANSNSGYIQGVTEVKSVRTILKALQFNLNKEFIAEIVDQLWMPIESKSKPWEGSPTSTDNVNFILVSVEASINHALEALPFYRGWF